MKQCVMFESYSHNKICYLRCKDKIETDVGIDEIHDQLEREYHELLDTKYSFSYYDKDYILVKTSQDVLQSIKQRKDL